MTVDIGVELGNLILVSFCSSVQLLIYVGLVFWAMRRRTLFVVRRWKISIAVGIASGIIVLLSLLVISIQWSIVGKKIYRLSLDLLHS